MYVVTSKQMYGAECRAVERGTSFSQLMENAGEACAYIIRKEYGINKTNLKKIAVICGKGKNGGDGFVVARLLRETGCDVSVILACGEPQAKDAIDNFTLLESAGIEVLRYEKSISPLLPVLRNADIIVDAVFGTGFSGVLDYNLTQLANTVNSLSAKTVAIDVPSGSNCDTAVVAGAVFKADLTIAISAYKPIHILKPDCKYCGKTVIADIGITDEDYSKLESVVCLTYNSSDIKKILPKKRSVSNKGTYGHALCICGSMRMVGAAKLSVGGALRSGAGLVTAAFPQSIYPALAPCFTEPLLLPLESNFDGTFDAMASTGAFEASKKATAALIGCGIGINPDTAKMFSSIIRELKIPTVIDADGINILSNNIDILKEVSAPVILTPHPGEMSRLCRKNIPDIVSDPVSTAFDFAIKYRVVVALKTANTVVCDGKSRRIYINPTGNAGLAKGGSGDLLAGMIVSFAAQGMEPFEAAVAAVYLHGLAADAVAELSSKRGMLPTDVMNYLPKLFSKFE